MSTLSADAINQVTAAVIAAAIKIHRQLGPGLLEHAYFACLCHELTSAAIAFEAQKRVPLHYEGVVIDCAYRADLVVAGEVVLEVKAQDAIAPVHLRQLRTYTILADCRVGLLLNFGAPTMREGIKRVVNRFPDYELRPPRFSA